MSGTGNLPAFELAGDVICGLNHSSHVSFNQEQICLLEAFYPGTRAYNAQAFVHLSGPFDPATFKMAINDIISRHEVFRTTIDLRADGYVATVHPQLDFEPELQDLSNMLAETRESALEALRANSMKTTFNLQQLPLLDIQVVRLSENEWQLIHIEHHVVHDGWSFGRFWGEVQQVYNDIKGGQTPKLTSPAAQYQQFVTWQRSKMCGEYGEKAVSFWREYLEGTVLDISLAKNRCSGATLDGNNFELSITPETYNVVKDAAQKFNVSEFVVMFSMFSMLLSKNSDQTDFAIGTAVSARTEPELETMLGMVVNTTPIRVLIPKGETVQSVCRSIQNSLFQALRYQDLPLSLLIRELGIVQQKGKNPIFQHCFSFHDSVVPKIQLRGIEGYIEETQNQTSKFDINVVVIPPNSDRGSVETRMFWQFSDGLFSHDECCSLIEKYLDLLNAIPDTE